MLGSDYCSDKYTIRADYFAVMMSWSLCGCSVSDGGGVDGDGRDDGGAVALLQGGGGGALLHGFQDLVSGRCFTCRQIAAECRERQH